MVSRRLLDAAIEQFGKFGFEGTSTRQIARASNTTMSSITYHYGGKHGLYLAAADQIVEAINERQRSMLADVARRTPSTSDEAIHLCVTYLDSFAAMMLSPESAPWARFIIREQFDPTEAFERIWEGLMASTLTLLLDLTSKALPNLPDKERRALVVLMLGQAIMLRASHASACRVLGTEQLQAADLALLRHRLASNVRAILRDEHPVPID
ncbi:MAG: yttP [Bradyrhizobium sp.]|nr:yttP [Bradyrhizobium sp.]